MLNVYNWYKFSNFLYKKKIPIVPSILTYMIRLIFGGYIPATSEIGRGTKIGYGGIGIVIHGRAVIGENCIISQCVTIGGTSKKRGVPKIGKNVLIGAGAKILGDINVGDNCVIAANSVVVNDVESNTLVGGIPAKIIKKNININDYK